MTSMRLSLMVLILVSSELTRVLASPIIAKINGEPIYQDELSQKDLDRAILFRLAVQEARHEKLDKNPDVHYEMDKILYKWFLDERLKGAQKTLEPTEAEVQSSYETSPMLRIRHLVLPNKTTDEKQKTTATLETIQAKLKEGINFKRLVIQYSQDEGAKYGGDLDFRGVHSLPDAFYKPALSLGKGAVSSPIEWQEALHVIQLIDRKSYKEAPSTYLEFLRSEIRKGKEKQFLTAVLSDLKKKAKIEVFKNSETP